MKYQFEISVGELEYSLYLEVDFGSLRMNPATRSHLLDAEVRKHMDEAFPRQEYRIDYWFEV